MDISMVLQLWVARSTSLWSIVRDHPRNCSVSGKKAIEGDKVTSVELQRLVGRNFSVEISSPTIRRYIRKTLKWTVVQPV